MGLGHRGHLHTSHSEEMGYRLPRLLLKVRYFPEVDVLPNSFTHVLNILMLGAYVVQSFSALSQRNDPAVPWRCCEFQSSSC